MECFMFPYTFLHSFFVSRGSWNIIQIWIDIILKLFLGLHLQLSLNSLPNTSPALPKDKLVFPEPSAGANELSISESCCHAELLRFASNKIAAGDSNRTLVKC